MIGMTLPDHHLTEGEQRVLAIDPHWKRLTVPFIALVLVAVASGAGIYFIPDEFTYALHARLAVAAVALVLMAVWSFVPYLRWKNTVYVFTTHRIKITTGVLDQTVDEIPLATLNAVGSEQTLLDRLLGCGTLIVDPGGDRGTIALRDVPKVHEVRAELFRLLEDASSGKPG